MANDIQRRIRRSKDSERRMARWLMDHDGPDPRPAFQPGGGLVTSTGRVGHVTGLQFDTLSKSYAGENKQQKVWAGLWGFWLKIVEKAKLQGKEPLLRIEPTNPNAKGVPVMHVITEDRHAELLRYEREALEKPVEETVVTPPSTRPAITQIKSYSKEDQLGHKPLKRRR